MLFSFMAREARLICPCVTFPPRIMECRRRDLITQDGRGLSPYSTASFSRCTIEVLDVRLVFVSFLTQFEQGPRREWRRVLSTSQPIARPDGTKGVERASRDVPGREGPKGTESVVFEGRAGTEVRVVAEGALERTLGAE